MAGIEMQRTTIEKEEITHPITLDIPVLVHLLVRSITDRNQTKASIGYFEKIHLLWSCLGITSRYQLDTGRIGFFFCLSNGCLYIHGDDLMINIAM